MQRSVAGWISFWVVLGSASAQDTTPVHGLWVWKTASVLETPGAEAMRNFCRSNGIGEVYASFSGLPPSRASGLVALLDRSHIRAEALLSRPDAGEPGAHRDQLLAEVRAVVEFNRKHPRSRFDGIHLDLEPQQLPENQGAGNLRFLPVLVETYRRVRALAEPAGMKVNADVPVKFLKGDISQRKMLLSALPRLTLMLYELSSPTDGKTPAEKNAKLRQESQGYLDTAYQGLGDQNLAKLSIGLRWPDYEKLLPAMLQSLDETLRANPRYLGWAWHSYNDTLKPLKP